MNYPCQLLCSKCGKSLKNYQALISHEKWKHQQPKYHKCDVCTKCFRDSFTLKRHVNSVHKTDNVNSVPRTKTAACPLCEFKGPHTFMSEHFSVQHNIELKIESLIFDNMTDFNEWKAGIEQETMSRYVKHRASRKNKDGTTIHHFYCHRDGHFSSIGKKIRSLKILGSNKINAHCPSFMKVTENSRVTVEFSSTHVGHCGDIGRLPLSKAEKDKIASQIAMNVPLKDILQGFQSSPVESEYNRVHLTKKKDLHNIIEQYQLNKDGLYCKRKNKPLNKSLPPNGFPEKQPFLIELTMPTKILELEERLKRIVKTIHSEKELHESNRLTEPLEVIQQSVKTPERNENVLGTSLEPCLEINVKSTETEVFPVTLMEPSVEVVMENTELQIKGYDPVSGTSKVSSFKLIRGNFEIEGTDYDTVLNSSTLRKMCKIKKCLQQKSILHKEETVQ